MKLWVGIIVFMIFFINNGFSSTNQTNSFINENIFEIKKSKIMQLATQKKDPFASGMFSLMYAGAGQFYNGDFTKGSLFFFTETVYFLFFYGIRLKFQNTYGVSSGFLQLNASDQVLILSSLFLYIALKSYSIYDAYQFAILNNEKIDTTLERIQLSMNQNDLKLSYTLRF